MTLTDLVGSTVDICSNGGIEQQGKLVDLTATHLIIETTYMGKKKTTFINTKTYFSISERISV